MKHINLAALITAFIVSFILFSSVNILAADTVNTNEFSPAYLGTTTTHNWSFEKMGTHTEHSNSWEHIYTGAPAGRDGEYDSITKTISYVHTYSGSLEASLKKSISASLGYSFGKEESFSVSKNSAPLKKGQYVKAYYAKSYDVTKIKQIDTIHTVGWELGYGSQYRKVNRYSTKTSYVNAKKAIFPQIKLKYYTSRFSSFSSNSTNSVNEELIRVEEYKYINGKYVLINESYTDE